MTPNPVDEHWSLSVHQRTIDTKDTTSESTPGHTVLEHRPGASPATKGHDRLMPSVEPTTDAPPPPTCPLCRRSAERTLTVTDGGVTTASSICMAGHLYQLRWLTDGAA